MSDKTIPDDEILWKLNHIRGEGYCNMFSVECVRDVAEQLEWDDVVTWIDDEVYQSPNRVDGEVWLRALKLAVADNEDYGGAVKLDVGGAIMVDDT